MKITKREKEVIELLVRGFTNKEIASFLEFHESSARAHVFRLMKKFDTKTRTELAYEAICRGYVKVTIDE